METNSKLNIYPLLLLPVAAVLVGGLVLLGMWLFSGDAEPTSNLPASPVRHTELALSEIVGYIGRMFKQV